MQDISLAFNNSNCSDVNPLKIFTGSSLILFPYKTLQQKRFISLYPCADLKWDRFLYTYRVNKFFNPLNASCATTVILLLDKSILRKLEYNENALALTVVKKFCSMRLQTIK